MSPPTNPSSQTILISGAGGFLATHIIHTFLEKGYNVRGTIRRESSAQKVRESHSAYADRLSFAVVPDITTPGAFDEAVKDVDGVIHTASPFVLDESDDYERDLLLPAIKGTTGILESVQRYNPSVKRVVITASFACNLDLSKGYRPGYVYTEADWNPCTYEEAKKGPGNVAYCASKVFAEKAAFDFVDKNRPNFSVSTICPPMVFGPNMQPVESMSKLNTSSSSIYTLMNGSTKEIPSTGFPVFADARDVAQAHLKAYEIPEAGGERFIICGGGYTNQMVCDFIRREYAERKGMTPKGNEGELLDTYKIDTSKAKKLFGMDFIGFEKCMRDTIENLLELEKKLGTA
jgi:nucleoside-diphosphate-sugar epimerase